MDSTQTLRISSKVFEGLDEMAASGKTNMFDNVMVYRTAIEMGYHEFAEFIMDNPKQYPELVFGNFEVEDE